MSSDSQVTIVQITNLTPHPNADTLSITYVLGDGSPGTGYPVVVRTSDYQIGDLAVYVPVDMICPALPAFAFLGTREKDRHVKAKRLRGIFSMGLLVPIEALVGCKAPSLLALGDVETTPGGVMAVTPGSIITTTMIAMMREGLDVTEGLGFAKYEPPILTRRHAGGAGGSYADGVPEHGISDRVLPKYTDIENIKRWAGVLTEGEEVIFTEKVHGANGRFVFSNGRLYVGTRRVFRVPSGPGLWCDMARKYQFERILSCEPDLALYGEVYGYVQDLRYGLGTDQDLVIFDAMDTRTGSYYAWDQVVALVEHLNTFLPEDAPKLKTVPVLYRGPWRGLDAHKHLAEGPSVLGAGSCIREGSVIRPAAERFTDRLGRTILKMVGEAYLTR
jgi:RNA ligase (TIGR02306 family)